MDVVVSTEDEIARIVTRKLEVVVTDAIDCLRIDGVLDPVSSTRTKVTVPKKTSAGRTTSAKMRKSSTALPWKTSASATRLAERLPR